MKFFKVIFSRIAIIALSIIAQIGLFILLGYYADRDIYSVHIILNILAIFLVLFIFLKDEPSIYKLPWIMIILVAPLFGIILYMLLGYRITPKKIVNRIKSINSYGETLNKKYGCIDQLEEESKSAYGQAQYLMKTTNMPLYKNQEATYYKTGELFYEAYLKEIAKAEKYIFMEYFIIEDGEMFNKILEILEARNKEGVKVYLMYDDVGSVGKVPWNYYKKLREKGIEAVKFNPFNPIVSGSHNNRDHRKITVIDGKVGFVSGMNLADEYINLVTKFGHWKDNGIMFKGNAVNNLVLSFIQLYNISNHLYLRPEDFLTDDVLEEKEVNNEIEQGYDGYLLPFIDGPSPVDNYYIGKNAFLNIINLSNKYIYIATPYLIVDFHFLEALKNAAIRGVDVRIITPHIADKKTVNILTKNSYYTLVSSGVKVYEYEPGFIHSKMIVSDDTTAIVGTINLDHRSFVHHYENAVWMYKTSCIFDVKKDFEEMFENDVIEIEKNSSKLKWYQRIIRNILVVFSVLF